MSWDDLGWPIIPDLPVPQPRSPPPRILMESAAVSWRRSLILLGSLIGSGGVLLLGERIGTVWSLVAGVLYGFSLLALARWASLVMLRRFASRFQPQGDGEAAYRAWQQQERRAYFRQLSARQRTVLFRHLTDDQLPRSEHP